MLSTRLRWACFIGAIIFIGFDFGWLAYFHYKDIQTEYDDPYLNELDIRNLAEKRKYVMFRAIDTVFDAMGVYEVRMKLFPFFPNTTGVAGVPFLKLRYFNDLQIPQYAICSRPYTRRHCLPGGIVHQNWLTKQMNVHFVWEFQCENSGAQYHACIMALNKADAFNFWLSCGSKYFRLGFSFNKDTGALNTKPFFCGKSMQQSSTSCVEADVVFTNQGNQIFLKLFPEGREPTYTMCSPAIESDLVENTIQWVLRNKRPQLSLKSSYVNEQFPVRLYSDGSSAFDNTLHMAMLDEEGKMHISIGDHMWEISNIIVTPATNSFSATLAVNGYFSKYDIDRKTIYDSHNEGQYVFLAKERKFDVIARPGSLFWFDALKNRILFHRWNNGFMECSYMGIPIELECSSCQDFYEFGSSRVKFKSNTDQNLELVPITSGRNGWKMEHEDYPALRAFVLVENVNTKRLQLFGRLHFKITNAEHLQGFVPVCVNDASDVGIACIYQHRPESVHGNAAYRGAHMILHCLKEMPELRLHDCKRYQFIYFMSTQKFSLVGYDPKDTVTFYMTENASTFYQTADALGLLANPEDAHKFYDVFKTLEDALSHHKAQFTEFQSKGKQKAEDISKLLFAKIFTPDDASEAEPKKEEESLKQFEEKTEANLEKISDLQSKMETLKEEKSKYSSEGDDTIKAELDELKDMLEVNDIAIERLEKMTRKAKVADKKANEDWEKNVKLRDKIKNNISENNKAIEDEKKYQDSSSKESSKEKESQKKGGGDEDKKDGGDEEKKDGGDEEKKDGSDDAGKRRHLDELADLNNKRKNLNRELKAAEKAVKDSETLMEKKQKKLEKVQKKLATFKDAKKNFKEQWEGKKMELSQRDEKRGEIQTELQTTAIALEIALSNRHFHEGQKELENIQVFNTISVNARVNLKRKLEWISAVTGVPADESLLGFDVESQEKHPAAGTDPSVCGEVDHDSKCYKIVENEVKEEEDGWFTVSVGTGDDEKEAKFDGTIKLEGLSDDPFQLVRIDSEKQAIGYGFVKTTCKDGECFDRKSHRFARLSQNMRLLFPASENFWFLVRRETDRVDLFSVNLNHVEKVTQQFFALPSGKLLVRFAGDYWDMAIFDRLHLSSFKKHVEFTPIDSLDLQVIDLETDDSNSDDDLYEDRQPPVNNPIFYIPKFNSNDHILLHFKKHLYQMTRNMLDAKNSDKLKKLLSTEGK